MQVPIVLQAVNLGPDFAKWVMWLVGRVTPFLLILFNTSRCVELSVADDKGFGVIGSIDN